MTLFEKIFGNRPKPQGQYGGQFKLLEGYRPVFHRWGGSVYESELVRSAINARATHISKLHVETFGSARPALQNKLKHGPNEFQTWSQFLYRAPTILDIHNTLFITPIFDQYRGVQSVGTGDDSHTSKVRDGKREGQRQENREAPNYQGGYPLKLPEALCHLYGRKDECIGTGAGVRTE